MNKTNFKKHFMFKNGKKKLARTFEEHKKLGKEGYKHKQKKEKTKISGYKKVNIGTKKNPRKVPNTYIKGLNKADKAKQIKSIKEQRKRPTLKSFKGKRSTHAQDFEKKYGVKITNSKWINDNLFKKAGQMIVLDKGKKAYFTSGSRPNQNPFSWAYARLASYLLKRGAFKVDGNELYEKYRVKKPKDKKVKPF
jgi:hypothetical protein